jgi:hypothetical protein
VAKFTEIDEVAWAEWVSTRPACVQELCRRLPPNRLYRYNGYRVTLYSYSEDNTVTVDISGEFNCVIFERHVFGVSPDDLEECDLPTEGEVTGALLTEDEDIEAHLEMLRGKLAASH